MTEEKSTIQDITEEKTEKSTCISCSRVVLFSGLRNGRSSAQPVLRYSGTSGL